MTSWMPVFDGVECGCLVESNDGQATFDRWVKCQSHENLSFKQLKKLAIDENLRNLEINNLNTPEEINSLRSIFYSAHGIEDVG